MVGVNECMRGGNGGHGEGKGHTEMSGGTWRGHDRTRNVWHWEAPGATLGTAGAEPGPAGLKWEVPWQTGSLCRAKLRGTGPALGLSSCELACTGVYWERTSADAEAQHVPAALQEPLLTLPFAPQLQIQQLPKLPWLLPLTHLGICWE